MYSHLKDLNQANIGEEERKKLRKKLQQVDEETSSLIRQGNDPADPGPKGHMPTKAVHSPEAEEYVWESMPSTQEARQKIPTHLAAQWWYTPILQEQLIDKPRIEGSKYLQAKGSPAEAPLQAKDVTFTATIYLESPGAYLPVQNFAYKIPQPRCDTKHKIEEKIRSHTNNSTSWTKCTHN